MSDQPGSSASMGFQEPEDLSKKEKKKKQKRKSESHVKRTMNPFMLWCQTRRGDLLKSQPGLRPWDISKQLGEIWRSMSDAAKQPFVDEACRLREENEKKFPDPKKSADHIKRPMNPFMIWCRGMRADMLKQQPGIKPWEISKQLGEIWKKMSDVEKKPFCDEAERIKAEFEKNHPGYKYQPTPKRTKAEPSSNMVNTASGPGPFPFQNFLPHNSGPPQTQPTKKKPKKEPKMELPPNMVNTASGPGPFPFQGFLPYYSEGPSTQVPQRIMPTQFDLNSPYNPQQPIATSSSHAPLATTPIVEKIEEIDPDDPRSFFYGLE